MATRDAKAAGKRRKRSTEEIRALILAAARELFAAHGYSGTTTKEIARVADVTEPAIFRAFGSKQELFRAAVLDPLDDFLAAYAGAWLPEPTVHGTPQQALRQFAEGLYSLVEQHRQLFAAVVTSGLVDTDLQPAFRRLEEVSNAVKQAHALEWDTPVAVRAMVAMVVAMAMFDRELYPKGKHPGRERIIDELTRILVGAAGLLDGA